MKRFCVIFYGLFCVCVIFCQEVVKLSPDGENIKIIGTRYSVNYDNGQASETVNSKDNAFDGDFSTIFASYDRSYTWVGLDLGEQRVITKVAFCPRQGYGSRLLLGVFEGANSPDFLDAIPLGIIKETPVAGKLTELAVTNSRGFRYVRYVGPSDVRCNIAELEFYGYTGEGDDSRLTQTTNIPDVVIHTENAEEVTSKETYLNGVVSFISEGGQNIYSDKLEIRGRGNASWNFPKKPYRLKLAKSASPLGCPAKARNWTLINNYGDKTLVRNLLAFDISRRLEMPYSPAGQLVNVYFNGEYKGCYQFCDHIDIRKNRVDIIEMSEDDVTEETITGGYFIEIDAYADSEDLHFYSKRNRIPVTMKNPDFDAMLFSFDPRRIYITNFFDRMEASVFSFDANAWRELLDAPTFVRHFLTGELSGNTDTYWSVYLSKQRGEDLFRVGPVWDFDIAFENDHRTHPINSKNDWICKAAGSFADGSRDMFVKIITSLTTSGDLSAVWRQYRSSGAITADALVETLNDYEKEIDASQRLNFTRWNILGSLVHENYQALGSYQAEVDVVRKYVTERVAWIDRKLGYSAIDEVVDTEINIRQSAGVIHIAGITSASEVTMYDIVGREVYRRLTQSDLDISTSGLRRGIYIVQVLDFAHGTRWSDKIAVVLR
jgi:hypothetical protein